MNRLLLLRKVAAVSRWRCDGVVQRNFASVDRIRNSIHKLLDNQEQFPPDDNSTLELHAALDALKKQLNEAAQCVSDCKRQDGEIVEAEQALDQAVVCLVDVLETKMQHPTDAFVKQIRELRDELGMLQSKKSTPSLNDTKESSAA